MKASFSTHLAYENQCLKSCNTQDTLSAKQSKEKEMQCVNITLQAKEHYNLVVAHHEIKLEKC